MVSIRVRALVDLEMFQICMDSVLLLGGGVGLGFILGNYLRLHSIRRVVSAVVSKYYYPHSVAHAKIEAMKGEFKLVIAVRSDLKMGQ